MGQNTVRCQSKLSFFQLRRFFTQSDGVIMFFLGGGGGAGRGEKRKNSRASSFFQPSSVSVSRAHTLTQNLVSPKTLIFFNATVCVWEVYRSSSLISFITLVFKPGLGIYDLKKLGALGVGGRSRQTCIGFLTDQIYHYCSKTVTPRREKKKSGRQLLLFFFVTLAL